MDYDFALCDAQARQRGENLDGSKRRECSLSPYYNPDGSKAAKSVLQDWVMQLSFMQQGVLLGAVRGPDGVRKFHPCKPLMRWYRRCILVSAFDHGVDFQDPFTPGGGSFTGPAFSEQELRQTFPNQVLSPLREAVQAWEVHIAPAVDAYLECRDELPHHFQMHAMHAFQVLGFKHPVPRIMRFWYPVYKRIVEAMHLNIENAFDMHKRLGDNIDDWRARADVSETRGCTVSCSD